jgi:hypothetical protein
MKKLLYLVLLVPSLIHAWTIVPGGIQVTVEYTEPSTDSDGTSLNDLNRTSLFYNLGSGDVKAFDVIASTTTGGGNVVKTTVIPWPNGKEGNVSFYAVAVDTNSAVSAKSNIVIVRFDTLSPGAPKALIISGDLLFYNYREPIVNTDGSPITDLASIRIFFNDSVSASLRQLTTVPASGPTGGESRVATFPLATFFKGSTVRIYARFVDTNNNISPFPTAIAIKIPE